MKSEAAIRKHLEGLRLMLAVCKQEGDGFHALLYQVSIRELRWVLGESTPDEERDFENLAANAAEVKLKGS
jgi:hypothetical protein